MAKDQRTQRQLELLQLAGNEHHGTLHASAVIIRLEMLLEDIGRIKRLLENENDDRAIYRLDPEVVSYYSVGFVTSLEWHARSRLADLFSYRPDTIQKMDLEGLISTSNIQELIAQGANIPQFIAAARNVSTIEAYTKALNRVLVGIGSDRTVEAIAKDDLADCEPSMFMLRQLFDYRNSLVHEIGREHIDHPIIRSAWSCEDSEEYGKLVFRLVTSIETEITNSASNDFPNRLDHERLRENVDDRIRVKIAELEKEIVAKNSAFTEIFGQSSKAIEAEEENLECTMPRLRWIDTTAEPRRALLRGRLNYLKALAQELLDESRD